MISAMIGQAITSAMIWFGVVSLFGLGIGLCINFYHHIGGIK